MYADIDKYSDNSNSLIIRLPALYACTCLLKNIRVDSLVPVTLRHNGTSAHGVDESLLAIYSAGHYNDRVAH